MPDPILYFVSYSFKRTSASGFGNAQVALDEPIRAYADLTTVVEAVIAANPGTTDVTILSWQRFES